MLDFNETEWRPEAWLSFLMTGHPAGTNTLPTMVPRVEPNNLILTQAKAVRKHARAVAREAQGLTHTTKGLQSARNVVDLTEAKVKSVKHYHYLKPEATMDASSHLKRKQQAIKELMEDLDPIEDYIELQHLKIQKVEVSRAILKELHKLDDKILGKRVVTLSSSGDNTSIDLSLIPVINDDDDYVDIDDDNV